MGIKRKRAAGKRTPATPTLIVYQGTITEPMYFQHMKELWRSRAVDIHPHHATPLKLVDHAKELARRKGYERVFIVIDEDDSRHELSPASAECQRASTRHRSFHLIVSHVCFEVWLLAHVRSVPASAQDRTRLSTLVRVAGLVENERPKYLSPDFPYAHWPRAQENVPVIPANVVSSHPATAVPTVIEALREAQGPTP